MENHQQKTEKPAAECAAGFSEFDLWKPYAAADLTAAVALATGASYGL
jgi:hypothetical protein